MKAIDVFVDEYGNSSLATEKDGVTAYFIITAILVRKNLSIVRDCAEKIRDDFFQTGEMKSSGIADNDSRRIAVLNRIKELPIKTYSIVIDKREIDSSGGLAHKSSFFKFLNKKLYRRIFDIYEHVRLVADEHGSEKFMEGFEAYVKTQIGLRQDLFMERTFTFRKSQDDVLLQVADIVSGSLARGVDPKKLSHSAPIILSLIAEQSVGIEHWPPRTLLPLRQEMPSQSGHHDGIVKEHCVRQAIKFIEKNDDVDSGDDKSRAQIETLKFLLFQVQFGDESSFIPTREIIRHLRSNCGIELTAHQIRSAVVSQLRDASVIIASGPKGYKIPICEADIYDFVTHAQTIVPPMLARLSHARSDLLMASFNDFDILAHPQFRELKALIDR